MLKSKHVLVFLVIGMSVLMWKVALRQRDINQRGEKGIAHAYKAKRDYSIRKSRGDLIYLEYFNGEEKLYFTREIMNDDIKINRCYEIIYIPNETLVPDVYFSKIRKCPKNLINK